jgi:hypothetical protein
LYFNGKCGKRRFVTVDNKTQKTKYVGGRRQNLGHFEVDYGRSLLSSFQEYYS